MMNNKTISKWFSMLLLMLVAGITGAAAQSLSISDFSIKAGDTKTVAITLTAEDDIYGVQTDLELCSGLTLEHAQPINANMKVYTNKNQSGDKIRMSLLTLNGEAVAKDANGVVINLMLQAADDFEGGTIKLSNSRLTTSTAGAEVKVSDTEATVTLEVVEIEQMDVTNKYLTNPGFDDGENGWTINGTGTTYHGVAAYGSSTKINDATNINVDKFGKNIGNAAFSNAGWGDSSYYTQEVTLPAGTYKLTFDVINRNSEKNIAANYFGWVPNDGDAIYNSTTSFEQNIWYTISVDISLEESTTGMISCGLKSRSGDGMGSGKTAKLFIDNIKIFRMDEGKPSIAKPVDYSDLINQTTWYVKQDDNATPGTSNALVDNITSGDWTGRYVERYRGVAGHYGKALYQTVSVPAGVYQVQAACMSSSANGVDAAAGKKDGDVDVAYFYANSEELTYPLSDKKGYYRKHIVTLDVDGNIEFGINTKVVGANWNAIGCATIIKVANSYADYIAELLSDVIDRLNVLKGSINGYLDDALYSSVVGLERTNLTNAKLITAEEETAEAYEIAINKVQSAIDAFVDAKANYDALVTEVAKAKALGIDAATADSYAANEESTAATSLASTQDLKVTEYNYVKNTYTETATLGNWTEDFAEDLNGEGYVNNGPTYWNEWGSATRTAKQTLTLPAGDYAISCIARGAVGTSGYLYYKVGDEDAVQVNFLMKGNRGRGVDTNGDANFSADGTYTCDNNGFGWEYNFLTFNLTKETTVELGASATFAGNWVSIYAPQLFTTEASVKALRLAEIAGALANVPSGNMNKDVKATLDDKKSAAEGATTTNTSEELTTILNELNEAISAAQTSIGEYDKISNYLTTAKTNFNGNYSSVEGAITDGDYIDTAEGYAAIKALRTTYATSSMVAGKDLTGLIDNNSFETGTTEFWTTTSSNDTGARSVTVENGKYAMNNSDGDYLFNTWWQGAPLTQNIGTLPAGAYELKGVVASNGGTIYITMNDKHEAFVETVDATGVGIEFAYTFTLSEAQEVTIGVVGGAKGSNIAGQHKEYQADGYWFYKADNFRLTYLGETAPDNTIDGTYYLSIGENKIARGGDSNTEAVMSSEGIPVVITTDKAGISKLQMKDTEKYLMWNNEMVYTDGTIEPTKTHHQPYWKVKAVNGGYQILNTESGLYLSIAEVDRDGVTLVASCKAEPAVWTLTDAALEAAKIELAAAIAAAPATPTANVGTAAFQIPQAEVTKLSNAKTNGQTVYENPTATLEDVNNAIAAFSSYDIETLNAPEAGKVYSIINVSDGYNHSGKAVTCKSASDADLSKNTTAFGYSELPGSIYPQGFTFAAVEGTKNGYKLSYTRADGDVVYIGTGSSTGLGNNNDQIRPTTDASKAVTIQIVATSTENVWNLYNTLASKNIGANGSNDLGFFTVNNYNSMKIQEAVNNEVSLNILATNQYGTLILPFKADIPSGVVIYIVDKVNGNEIDLKAVNGTQFEANTPYVVFAENGVETTLSGLGAAYTDASYTTGLLTGTYEQINAPIGSYVLQNHDGNVAFYRVQETIPPVNANRAYLSVSSGNARVYYLNGEATAIRAIEALTGGDAEIYDVNGRRQVKLQKGVNIIRTKDGRTNKVMVK